MFDAVRLQMFNHDLDLVLRHEFVLAPALLHYEHEQETKTGPSCG